MLFPWIIFTKKRYVGLLYETDPDKKPKLKYMGIALKRRDYAAIVKTMYNAVLEAILHHKDVPRGVEVLREMLTRFKAGGFPIEDLVVSKTLRADYKNPESIAHKVLAERMGKEKSASRSSALPDLTLLCLGERDPGTKPATNDRIPYVYVVRPGARLQGDRIEPPDYVRENRLPVDYDHYIQCQIMVSWGPGRAQ